MLTSPSLCGLLLNERQLALDRGQLHLEGLLGLSSSCSDSRSKSKDQDHTHVVLKLKIKTKLKIMMEIKF
jgi:hypothetical protein